MGTSDYPYTARDGTCNYDQSKAQASIKAYTDVKANDCSGLTDSIAQQPVSVAIAANAIMFYTSGIFSDTTCNTQVNHGVTAVGYGADGKDFFWLVRNSWGGSWGEAGYIRFTRSDTAGVGICLICTVASYPTL